MAIDDVEQRLQRQLGLPRNFVAQFRMISTTASLASRRGEGSQRWAVPSKNGLLRLQEQASTPHPMLCPARSDGARFKPLRRFSDLRASRSEMEKPVVRAPGAARSHVPLVPRVWALWHGNAAPSRAPIASPRLKRACRHRFATIGGVFHIHRAERADGLVAALGAVISAPLDDPLQAEVVAVPTRGVERWLTQRLSAVLGASPGRADGVCANVEFPFPGRLVNGAVAAAAGVDREADPWLPERSVWPLLDVVEASLGEPWLAPLAAHLGGAGADADASRRARRLSSVRHIADLYDRYAVHRPAMLRGVGGRERRRLAGRVVEAAARAHRRAEPGRAAGRRLRAAAGRAGARRPAGARVAVRPDASAGELPRRSARARGRAGRAPLPSPPLGRAVGADRLVHP